jgi:hypothetical protein
MPSGDVEIYPVNPRRPELWISTEWLSDGALSISVRNHPDPDLPVDNIKFVSLPGPSSASKDSP